MIARSPSLSSTMWESEVKDDNVKVNEKELEELFAAKKIEKKAATAGADEGGEKKKKDEIVTLVDPKTANNTAIAISRFKASCLPPPPLFIVTPHGLRAPDPLPTAPPASPSRASSR